MKQQILMVVLGSLLLTLVFGGLLSVAVNLTLEQIQNQPDLIIPGPNTGTEEAPAP